MTKYQAVCVDCGKPMRKSVRLVLATQVIQPAYYCTRSLMVKDKTRHQVYYWTKVKK